MSPNKQNLNPHLLALLGSQELVDVWWTSPNKAFMAECPEDADVEVVRDYIMWHCYAAGG